MSDFEGMTDEQFERLAEEKNWRCERDGKLIRREDEPIYYLTGYCGYCNHMREKIMSE
jgi:hypothetical protein